MDRQTLRDWVHRFNAAGPDGLRDSWSNGPPARLSPEQLAELAEVVESGPDPAVDGVVRWRRIDLKKVIEERFGVSYHERHVSTLLKRLGFSHVSARPRHPAQDAKIVEAFKKLSTHPEGALGRCAGRHADRDLVPRRSPDRPEERPDPAMGKARHATSSARRSTLRERLPVRRHLSGPRHGRSAGASLRRHGSDAAPPRRDRPHVDTEAMQLHLDEISRNVAKGAHAVLLLDRAGWHTTGKLDVPTNITPIFLPSRAPELNPVENLWQYLRGNWLSNRVFDTYDAIIDAACQAWMNILGKPEIITSIGMRDWAHVGQLS